MIRGVITFDVSTDPDSAFAYISDPAKQPEWVPDVVSTEKRSPGDVTTGTQYAQVVEMGNRTSEGTLEVTEFERPSLFAYRGGGGPVGFTARFHLEPTEAGTRITHEYAVELTGLMRLLAPFLARGVHRNSAAAMDSLRGRLGTATPTESLQSS